MKYISNLYCSTLSPYANKQIIFIYGLTEKYTQTENWERLSGKIRQHKPHFSNIIKLCLILRIYANRNVGNLKPVFQERSAIKKL